MVEVSDLARWSVIVATRSTQGSVGRLIAEAKDMVMQSRRRAVIIRIEAAIDPGLGAMAVGSRAAVTQAGLRRLRVVAERGSRDGRRLSP